MVLARRSEEAGKLMLKVGFWLSLYACSLSRADAQMGLFGAKKEYLLRKALTRGDVVTLTESKTRLFDAGNNLLMP